MNIVRPNHFDRRTGAWVVPDWVYPSGTTIKYYRVGMWGTPSGIVTATHRTVSRELVELFRSYNAEKIANGGAPFSEACVYFKTPNAAAPDAYVGRGISYVGGGTYPGGIAEPDLELIRAQIATWTSENELNAAFFRDSVWWSASVTTLSQSYHWNFNFHKPSEYYPTEFVAFNLRGDYGAPNTYDRHYYVDEEDTGDGATAANWYNINSRPLVVVENLTTGERAVLRSIDDHGTTHKSGEPCPLYGTFFLKRGNDYRITRYRAVYAETVERASREESTEPMKFHRFDPLPPTTQTVAASEIATATFFDLSI